MWTYVLGPLLSLLPQAWRTAVAGERPINWTRAVFISGIIMGLLSTLGLIGWYLHFIQIAINEQAALTAQALQSREPPKGLSGAGASYAMGLASLVAFLMQPLTWVLAYFGIEGIWRALAAALTEESPASLPLLLLAKTVSAFRRKKYEMEVPVVADVVTRGEGKEAWDLRVASCRPKPEWRATLTIRYHDEFFKVTGESQVGATPSRPHVYLLKRAPQGEALRGIQNYSPEELLKRETMEGPSGLSGVFGEWRERRRIARLPRMKDNVLRGDARAGWDLKIESCRPKPDWTRGRTIHFEGNYYRMDGEIQGPPERPFGFLLNRLAPNEALRGPLAYDPEEPLHE